ncbi:hypothetical protein BpHYR1_029243, partial [Brachionus plicatilis]
VLLLACSICLISSSSSSFVTVLVFFLFLFGFCSCSSIDTVSKTKITKSNCSIMLDFIIKQNR